MNCISNYDFSGKRVRYQGKVMDKFALAYHIDAIKPWSYATVSYNAFSYSELADRLKFLLS